MLMILGPIMVFLSSLFSLLFVLWFTLSVVRKLKRIERVMTAQLRFSDPHASHRAFS